MTSSHKPKLKTYLFIDEVQEIDGFEKAIRNLVKSGQYDIYLTGSNSELLSSDLAGKLSGRYLEIHVHPLSYTEFLLFHHLEKNLDSLEKYMRYGGLPFLANLRLNDEQVFGYLKNVYDAVILKDVISRFSVRNINFLTRLVEYLANNLGSLVSSKKISDFLKSQNINLSPNTILNYLSYLSSSFFINKAQRIDIAGKKIFEISEKYYFEDLGMRHVITDFKQIDINKILENLQSVKDNYPKYVVTMDKMASGNVDGITHLHILDFLTSLV